MSHREPEMAWHLASFIVLLLLFGQVHSSPVGYGGGHCEKTEVLILGAGTAGITAAQTLTNQSIHDFIILEYQDHVGGRANHTTFGAANNSFTVELGANWVQGLGTPPGPENPIWTLAQKYGVNNTYSNYSSILTYDKDGYNDYSNLLSTLGDDVWTIAQEAAGYILTDGLKDNSVRTAFSLAGWFPGYDAIKQAVEWWEWDWETAYSPEQSSEVFGFTGYNLTFYQYSEANNYVWDQRGFNTFIKGEASTFLGPNDPRLKLNTVVTEVDYSNEDFVNVTTKDGSCYQAKQVICTFSLGVLQHSIVGDAPVTFKPEFPRWKKQAILGFDMGIYTKLFIQFPEVFWDENTQFFLYADPTQRGYYPVWQSLTAPGFLPESNTIFATVVTPESQRIERQSDEQTQAEMMEVLRKMFPNVTIPDPIAFMYPRWGETEWAYGSYSNWPTGVGLLEHQNLRAGLSSGKDGKGAAKLWFAGEHTSAEYFGFLHGAYFEGLAAGLAVADCLNPKAQLSSPNVSADGFHATSSFTCGAELNHYPKLYSGVSEAEFTALNGWFGGPGASFVDYVDN